VHVHVLLAGHRPVDGSPVTFPIEIAGTERWLQTSQTDFDGGCVYALRDITEERLLERTRSEFVATASHELRTPIAAVFGTFQTLLRDDVTLTPEQQEQFLRIGLSESSRLARIVDDLLLVGQLDGGAPNVARTRCDVAELVAEVASVAGHGTHELVVDIASPLDPIDGDPQRVRQVLLNLVENAVKYSPDGGTITITAGQSRGKVAIEVQDEGIGIPPADQGRIFERFVRLDPALSRGVGGTGLGLYICRELLQRMDGTIAVRSPSAGQGSIFRVELPSG
jgi:signal transduction histidine kinase